MLPYVMEFNLPAAVGRYAEIAKMLSLGGPNDHPRALADKAVLAITALAQDIGIPKQLRDVVGAKEDFLPLVAHDAMKSVQLKFNPRIATEQEILGMLHKAF
jgi:alcohol dehydrogenase